MKRVDMTKTSQPNKLPGLNLSKVEGAHPVTREDMMKI